MKKGISPRHTRWFFSFAASEDPFVNFPTQLESIGRDEDFAFMEALRRVDIFPNCWQESHGIKHMWANNGDFLYGVDVGWGTTWYKATKI